MDFFNKIPVMDADALRELKKGIDLGFRDFSDARAVTSCFSTSRSIWLFAKREYLDFSKIASFPINF